MDAAGRRYLTGTWTRLKGRYYESSFQCVQSKQGEDLIVGQASQHRLLDSVNQQNSE
jgi:hypothetical protein